MVFTLKEFTESTYSREPHYFVIGHPISHSLSPLMHQAALDHYGFQEKYVAIDLQPDEVNSFIAWCSRPQFRGCNITLPYKQLFMDAVDEVTAQARKIGAINTIVKEKERLIGHNTDIYGFLKPLEPFRNELDGREALIFGTGGASRAVVTALFEIGIRKVWLVSRNPLAVSNDHPDVEIISYDQWTAVMDPVSIVVNSTPLGMHPATDRSPVRESEISWLLDRICYDLIYNPLHTKFLRESQDLALQCIGGLEMFIHQGSRSFQLWTGREFPYQKIETKLLSFFSDHA